jgi:hypothetical protein
MVISEPGLLCLESSSYRLVRGLAALWFGPSDPDSLPDHAYLGSERPPVRMTPRAPETVPAAVLTVSAAAAPSEIETQQYEEPAVNDTPERDETETQDAPLTAQERRARSAALRGLLLSRQRRFSAAQSAFTEAARLDPELSLESVPTFWDLERGAHEAVVRAYSDVGRTYEASMLASRLRTTFRPRLLAPRGNRPSTVG